MSKEKDSNAVNSSKKKKKRSKDSNSPKKSKKPKNAGNSQENASCYFYSQGKSTKKSHENSFEESRHDFASNVWQHQYHPYQRNYSNNWYENRSYNRFPQTYAYEQSTFSNRGRRGGHLGGGRNAKRELTEEEQRFAKATKNLKESRVENAVKVSCVVFTDISVITVMHFFFFKPRQEPGVSSSCFSPGHFFISKRTIVPLQ